MVTTSPAWEQKIHLWQRRRIIIWTATAMAFLAAYFHRTVMGVVADSLMRDFAMERATDLGILASIYFWTYAALQIPAGFLADIFGPRQVISAALLVSTAGTVLFGVTDNLTGLYIGRFLTTLGIAVIFVSIIKIQSDWFRLREFATMSGLMVFVGNSGSLFSATPMAFIVENWGWRTAFFLIAGYSLLMALVCWVVVRNRPEDIGLPGIIEIEAHEGNVPVVLKQCICEPCRLCENCPVEPSYMAAGSCVDRSICRIHGDHRRLGYPLSDAGIWHAPD